MIKRVPHTYVIVFYIIIFSAILTWVVPGGSFERETVTVNGVSREIIKAGSFHYTEQQPQTWQLFSAFFDGFRNTSEIIVFILMIGGAFWIMNESKAIDVGINSFLKSTKKFEKWKFIRYLGVDNIIITLIMLLFSVFGAVFGMSEETIAFTIIFVPLAISMGYDSIVGVSLCFVAAALGFAGAILNPFTIGIAQGLSSIPLFSGIEYRLFSWFMINLTGISYVLWYARKVKHNPEKSLVYEEDIFWRNRNAEKQEELAFHTPKSAWIVYFLVGIILIVYAVLLPSSELKVGNSSLLFPIIPLSTAIFLISGFLSLRKTVHYFILNLLAFTIVFLIIGVMGYQWYVMEIAALFLAMGIFSGLSMGKTANEITRLFIEGAKDILSAAMVVGLAGGIIVILRNGQIIDTILYAMSKSMDGFNKIVSIEIMYAIQNGINMIIPSGSAKAALTMPIMSQFSDLVGISRQSTVLAFQFGDGFTNMLTPTSGVLIGVLGIARIPYEKWIKWIAPLMLFLIVLGGLLLVPTVIIKLSGF
ncbi:MAG: YfcC family protein [Prolixibacteraceae bacterium]